MSSFKSEKFQADKFQKKIFCDHPPTLNLHSKILYTFHDRKLISPNTHTRNFLLIPFFATKIPKDLTDLKFFSVLREYNFPKNLSKLQKFPATSMLNLMGGADFAFFGLFDLALASQIFLIKFLDNLLAKVIYNFGIFQIVMFISFLSF